jgi:hypothetical protein
MSAPTDRPHEANTVFFYAPKRAARLAQRPEAAAGQMPDEPRDELAATAANDRFEGDRFEGDAAIQRLRARRSLDPEFPPAPPAPVRRKSLLGAAGRLGLVILAAAIVALFAVGQFPFPELWRQQLSERVIELASHATRPAAPPAQKRTEPVIPQLVVQDLRGNMGEPAPLGVALQGRAEGALVLIVGLVPGMTLSSGGAVGSNAWQVPATELGNTWIFPPKDFVGVADLMAELRLTDNTIVHRRSIRLEWTAPPAPPPVETPQSVEAPRTAPAPQAAAAPQPAAASQAVAAVHALVQPSPQIDRDEIAVLVKRGREFVATGDLAAARLMLRRAAEASDADAALALAATYDPAVLRELRVYGFAADVGAARMWYEKAKELGSPEARRRLEMLASGAR